MSIEQDVSAHYPNIEMALRSCFEYDPPANGLDVGRWKQLSEAATQITIASSERLQQDYYEK